MLAKGQAPLRRTVWYRLTCWWCRGLGRETLLAIRFGRQLTHHRRGLHPATTLQWKLDGAYLLILLFSFQFPLLLWAKLGLFLLFLLAFVFTSPVTHVFFSLIEKGVTGRPRMRNAQHSNELRQLTMFYPRLPHRCVLWSKSTGKHGVSSRTRSS